MSSFTSMAMLFLLAVVPMTSSPVKAATDCKAVMSNVFPCSNFLKSPGSVLPENSCCNAARKWNDLGDANSVCKCIQPIISQFLLPKLQQLPTLCNLNFELVPLVECLLPTFDDDLGGLIPHLPFTLPPLPSFPLPPLPKIPPELQPWVPLPPLLFGPPAKNQQKTLPDGLLPPLPFPLPPLPSIPLPPINLPPLQFPLPPLPPFPFSLLPFVPRTEKHISEQKG